jgi:hypothetical protein
MKREVEVVESARAARAQLHFMVPGSVLHSLSIRNTLVMRNCLDIAVEKLFRSSSLSARGAREALHSARAAREV